MKVDRKVSKGKQKGNAYAQIPAEHRSRIRTIMQQTPGIYASPIACWRAIARHWKKQEQERAAKDANKKRREREYLLQLKRESRQCLPDAVGDLGSIAEILKQMERGKHVAGLGAEDSAKFSRVMLEDAGRRMEQALFDLGFPIGTEGNNGDVWGTFNEYLKLGARKEETA